VLLPRVAGGEAAAVGQNWVERSDGTMEELGSTATVEMQPRDVFVIETPGGGGYGLPEEWQSRWKQLDWHFQRRSSLPDHPELLPVTIATFNVLTIAVLQRGSPAVCYYGLLGGKPLSLTSGQGCR